MKRLVGIVSIAAVVLALVSANTAQASTYIDAININIQGGDYGGFPSTGTPVPSTSQVPAQFNANWNQLRFGDNNDDQPTTDTALNPGGNTSNWYSLNSINTALGTPVLLAGQNGLTKFHISGAMQTVSQGDTRWNEQSYGNGYGGTTYGLLNATTRIKVTGRTGSWSLYNIPFAAYEVWGYEGNVNGGTDSTQYSWQQLTGTTTGSGLNTTFTTQWADGSTVKSFAAFQILQVEQAVPEPSTLMLLGLGGLSLIGVARRMRK